jgi:propanol-preferring alcohol dehydrogenase
MDSPAVAPSRAWQLPAPASVESAPLRLIHRRLPEPAASGQPNVRLRVLACGVCRTDLHVVEGDLPPRRLPIIPGHQVVGVVEAAGPGLGWPRLGERVGLPWLFSACGHCADCRAGRENLCAQAQFTGWDADGGYASHVLAHAEFLVPLPPAFEALQAAPLLCAGVIGYRALRVAEVQPGERVGLFGFGASAHLALQVLRHWGCDTAVFTRGAGHRQLAESLGAAWTGGADNEPDWPLDRAVIFAPAGTLVPHALARLRPGGILAINAIHMSPIPEMDYNLLYGERQVRSVANATRQDAAEFMALAASIPVQVDSEPFALDEANTALLRLKRGEVRGAAVLVLE